MHARTHSQSAFKKTKNKKTTRFTSIEHLALYKMFLLFMALEMNKMFQNIEMLTLRELIVNELSPCLWTPFSFE